MKNVMILPDGNAISSSIIKSVSLHDGRGVICRDAQQRPVSWIKVSNIEIGKRVRDVLISFMRDGRIAQPDWEEIFTESGAE
jgi:hypothetical protein